MREAVTIRYKSSDPTSVPERELFGFVSAVTDLLGTKRERPSDW